jgi:hypothetical protein
LQAQASPAAAAQVVGQPRLEERPKSGGEAKVAAPEQDEQGGQKIPFGIFTKEGRKLYLYQDGTIRPSKIDNSPPVPLDDLVGLKVGYATESGPGKSKRVVKGNDGIIQWLKNRKAILTRADPSEMRMLFYELVRKYSGKTQGDVTAATDVSGTQATGSGKRGRFEKGSAEAKAFMAELRAKRKKM